jgi:Fur family ferric uptake transcriptional regulator
VFDVLSTHSVALSQKEIELKLSGPVDRVTLYRTLRLFVSRNLVHKITVDEQTVKYRLINPKRGLRHPHFHCRTCDRVLCLPEINMPPLSLPQGFTQHSSNLLVEGICDDCN